MDPSASTNFGKLTNVSLQLTPSADAVTANEGNGATPQQFQVYIRALNFNIVRVSGGALGSIFSPEKYCASEILALSLEKRLVTNFMTSASLVTCC